MNTGIGSVRGGMALLRAADAYRTERARHHALLIDRRRR